MVGQLQLILLRPAQATHSVCTFSWSCEQKGAGKPTVGFGGQVRSILPTPPSPDRMEAAKAFYGLLSGLSKRLYFADDTITDEFLQEELFADAADGASRISALP